MEKPTNLIEKYVISADATKIFSGALSDPGKPENSKGFYLVRFDMRGHGRTGKPDIAEAYSSKKHAEDYAAVVNAFNAKKPILVGWSWGSTLAGDVASHLPPGSVHGAVYVAAHPTLRNMIPLAFTPGLTSLWEWASNDDAQASNYPIVLNRLCFARMPNVSSSFYEETVRLNDEGEDFVPENPAATYGIRLATMGMITTMKPIHRRLTAEHLNDGDILELLANGFPILEVIVTHDTFLKYDMVLESLKSISKNLDVHLIRGASHMPFVHAPDEVMKAGHTKVRGEGPHAVHTVSPLI